MDTGIKVRIGRSCKHEPMPKFTKPEPVGYFSITEGPRRRFKPSAEQLKYLKLPANKNFPLDLNKGANLSIKKPEEVYDERLIHLLQFIHHSYATLGNLKNTDFVCYRGLLRLIMCTPFEYRQEYHIIVTHFNGICYMYKKDTLQDKHQRARETAFQRRFCSYGFKFEQYCLSDSPLTEPETEVPVDECSEFSTTFCSKLENFRLLYGAEIDGIKSNEPVQLEENIDKLKELELIELKVRQGNLNKNQKESYLRHKTLNWWCQAFLVGIREIFVGMRTEHGLVNRIEQIKVSSLPKQGNQNWNPSACFIFLREFLTSVKSIVSAVNCPYTTFDFHFIPNQSQITYTCTKDRNVDSFLPDWYINFIDGKKNEAKIEKNKQYMAI